MLTPPRILMRALRAAPEGFRQRLVRSVAPSFTLGSQVRLVRDDGRILLVKASYRWRWSMPGGLLDKGETPEQTALRETKEETGLDIELLGPPQVLVETDMQRVNFIFDGVPAPGVDPDALTPQASEILEIGWFDQEELPETTLDPCGQFIRDGQAASDATVVITEGLPRDQRPESDSTR